MTCSRNRFTDTPQLHQFNVAVYLRQPAVACLCQECARNYRMNIELCQCLGPFSPLAFSGLALLPLVALYLYLAFFLLLAQSSVKIS
ncbi:hypothetical protein ACK1ML_003412 [Salmonella enterica]